MSFTVVLLTICLIILSYTLGFVAGTNSQWKDETEKHIRGLESTINNRELQIETQKREIEVLTADLNATKNACLTSFEDIGNRLNELESEPNIAEITDRLNKMSDILVNLMRVEGGQGEGLHTMTTDEMPSYTLLDMIDKKEEERHAE